MNLSLYQLQKLLIMLRQLAVFAELDGSRLEAHAARLLVEFVEARIAKAEVDIVERE